MKLARLLVLGMLLSGCTGMILAALKPPQVSVEDVNPVELGLVQQRFEIQLRVENPNRVDLPLESLSFDLAVNGLPLASASSDQRVVIPGGGSQLVKLDAITTSSRLIRQLRALSPDALRNGASYSIKGRAKVRGLNWLPFEKSGKVGRSKSETNSAPGQTI